MKARAFEYVRPSELQEACELCAYYGPAGQILAGGQSLVPALNFRVNAPAVLIDINRISALTGIERRGGFIRIGAMTRHSEIETSELVHAEAPLIAEAIRHVAHPAIRSRGTFGGSLAMADPAAELPACVVALEAQIVLSSTVSSRTIPARDFYRGLFETELRPGEILTEVLVPRQIRNQRSAFIELARRHGDFAIVGVASQADLDPEEIRELRLVVFGSEPSPKIALQAAAAARGRPLSSALCGEVAEAASADLDPMENLQGSAALKRSLARTLVRRAMSQIMAA